MADNKIESVLREDRQFDPPQAFVDGAALKPADVDALRKAAAEDHEGFWAEQAESIDWFRKWDQVLDWKPPFAQWFVGGKTNVSYNCIDRHLTAGRRNKAALIWEGEPGDWKVYTYWDLYREVCRFANVMMGLGLQPLLLQGGEDQCRVTVETSEGRKVFDDPVPESSTLSVIDDFVRAVETGSRTICPAEEALKTNRVIYGGYRASAGGSPVSLG